MAKDDITPANASLEQVKEKYRLERDKRLRDDGTAQYVGVTGDFADLARDRFADPDFKRDAIAKEVDTVVIGAGFGGMLTAVDLARRGQNNFFVIDKASDFGGTWYWNRYPGAACDVESYIYMPLLEETGYMPVEKYSKAPEIFEHCQRIARQFDLYPKALFQTVVEEVRWSDDEKRWTVKTDRGDVIKARFVVIGGGILHKPKLPGIPGIETFKGHMFHTTRWDYEYTGGGPTEPMTNLGDKRIALIGTGATSIQIVPKLAEAASHLFVVQRTPSGVGVRANRPTDPEWANSLKPGWQRERMANFTRIVSGEDPADDLVDDGFSRIFKENPDAFAISGEEQELLDLEAMNRVRARIDEIVEDRATAEALKPWYNQMCKRPCFHDEYLPSFNRPNVTLVDTGGKGIERVTEKGIVVDGVEYAVDCIIYASGFSAAGTFKDRVGFELYGHGGVSLTEAWSEGPGTLHGVMSRGFPNLIQLGPVQVGVTINFVHLLWELGEHAGWIVDHCLREGIETLEPTAESQELWLQTLLGKVGARGAFISQCTPSYFNAEGKRNPNIQIAIRSTPFLGSTMEYFELLKSWREQAELAGMEVHRLALSQA